MLYPMFAMVLLTLVVALVAIRARFSAVLTGRVHLDYFRLMEGQETTEAITKTTRCFNNLFEIPVLFYVAGVLHISLGIENTAGLILAWLFVLSRCAQAAIHLTYNRVLHRMSAFWAGFICAFGLWVNLVVIQL